MKALPSLLLSFLVLVGALVVPARAQLPGNQGTMNAAMLKLFSDIPGFSSKADIRLLEKQPTNGMSMTVDIAMLAGKVRMDLDMANLKSAQLSPQMVSTFKAAGLDKLATILRPDRKSALLIYPTVKGFVEMPMSKEEAADVDRKYKMEKTRLGREVVDGRSCEKHKVVVAAEGGGPKQEALVWYAPDLKNFPVKVEMQQGASTVSMLYREVKLVQPDVKQFEAPAGFTQHASAEMLMQNAMMKMMGGNNSAPPAKTPPAKASPTKPAPAKPAPTKPAPTKPAPNKSAPAK